MHDHDTGESCNYRCGDSYKGEDFELYLKWHMDGDLFDSMTIPNIEIRNMIIKYWNKLSLNTKIQWKNFEINNSSGRAKFGDKELKENPNIKLEYDSEIEKLLLL
jgi:hypothetical protein